jgi:hypothetical protein
VKLNPEDGDKREILEEDKTCGLPTDLFSSVYDAYLLETGRFTFCVMVFLPNPYL